MKLGINSPCPEKSLVAIAKCPDYEYENVYNALKSVLDSFGGLERFVKEKDKVFLKPNLLTAKGPDSAATTHPSLVEALSKMIREIGANAQIGDSPAGISRPIQQYWDATGMAEAAKKSGAELVVFESNGVKQRVVEGRKYYIAASVAEADIVFNISKMKTHGLTLFTGAVKNIFGVIPGFKKGEFHLIAPKVEEFSEIIVDIFQAVNPELHIMDAVVAMENNGPSSGTPKKVGYIAASTDGVALDAIMAHAAGFEQNEIHTTRIAAKRGLGESLLDRIEISGADLSGLQQKHFRLPTIRIQQYLPEFFTKMLGRFIWVRPRADRNQCERCKLCIKNCPVSAMKSEDGFPVINYETCIKCFCCDEICPHNAIEQQASWLVKKFM